MASQPEKPLVIDGGCLYDGPALPVPRGHRILPKKLMHLEDQALPRRYWYLTAGLTAAALVMGLLLGRFLLG
jgi:hypothetical protein